MASTERPAAFQTAAAAFAFIVLLGVVSLFADMTYEGARGITGPFLAVLGASGTMVGLVAGLGELVGYGLRLVSGIISDRTRRYWLMTIIGYVVNLGAVPLLALAGNWQWAALLIVLERTGKALRSPARDAMLSRATETVGHGKGFGVHEAMDQIGALAGPVLVSLVLAGSGDYRMAFAVLALPAIATVVVLLVARQRYPEPRDVTAAKPLPGGHGLGRRFWLYLAATALVAAGYSDFQLVAFHFQRTGALGPALIPLAYALAMAADAVSALVGGWLFDRVGLLVVAATSALAAFAVPFVFLADGWWLGLGVVLWGVGLGAQESIMRAAVARLAPAERRGVAFGSFNAGYGLAWFVGSLVLGVLYDRSIMVLVVASVGIQFLAVPLFVWSARTAHGHGR